MQKLRRPALWSLLLVWIAVVGAACSNSDRGSWEQGQIPCDSTATPIVFVHGFLEVGDAFANQSMRFASNGYCLDRIYAFDWNTLGDFQTEERRLEAFVDEVLRDTGASQIDLAGHSMGTFLSSLYLSEPANATQVAHYGNLAGLSATEPPGGVPTITLSSPDDYVAGVSTIEGAVNVELPGQDHLQIATSAESFFHLYRFFNNGAEPSTLAMQPAPEIALSGVLVTFAENQPAAGLALRIYPVDPATGIRLSQEPEGTFTADAGGCWGPFPAAPGQHYEYEILGGDPDWPPIHYYREPLPRSCRLVDFRVFPAPDTLPGRILKGLPLRDDQALVATLTLNQATVSGRDSLFVDGYEVSSPEVAPPEKTLIATFFFDINENGITDATAPGGLFDFLPFLQAFDLVVDAESPRPVPVVFNGRAMAVQNWRSATEGLSIAMFE